MLVLRLIPGKTFKSYLQRVRCDVAEQLLNSTNMTVLEVSEAIGYKDVKYFQDVFKKHKNVTSEKIKSAFRQNTQQVIILNISA